MSANYRTRKEFAEKSSGSLAVLFQKKAQLSAKIVKVPQNSPKILIKGIDGNPKINENPSGLVSLSTEAAFP